MRDLYNSIEVRRGNSPIAAVTNDTAFVSEVIDMRGFRSLVWCVLVGSLVDANATFAVLMEESVNADFSSQTAVDDANMDPLESVMGFDFADDDTVRKIGYTGTTRYVRLTITPSGNSGDVFLAVMALMGNPNQLATTAQAT